MAWLGNLVPQLHVHVIGRRPGDPCWPQPVWSHLELFQAYHPEEVVAIWAGLLSP